MGDYEDKQRAFALSLVAAYSSNLDYFQQVLDVLGSYTGDCPQTLYTMGSTLFQQNPALLEQFFCLYPWARQPEDQGAKDEQSVKHSEDEGAKDEQSVKSEAKDEQSVKSGVKEEQSVKHSEESGANDDRSVKSGANDEQSVKSGVKEEQSVKHSEESGANDDQSVKSGAKDEQSVKSGAKDEQSVNYSEESGAKDDQSVKSGAKDEQSVKSGVKDEQRVKHSEESGLNVDKRSSLKNLSLKKLKLNMSEVSLCSTVNANIVDTDITCGNRSDIKFGNTSKTDLKIVNTSKTDTPLRRTSRVVKVPASGYKNDLPEDVLLQVSQLRPQLKTPEISDSSDDFEDDYNFEKSYEKDIMESENYHHKDHTRVVNSQKTERISCPKCQKHFKTKKYLREHIRLLKCRPIVKTEILSCPKCQKQFKAKKYLRAHIRLQTCRPRPIVKTFQCPKCNKSFRKEGFLTQHKNLKHKKCDRPSSWPEFQCQKCNRSFYNQGHLTIHTNRKVKCDIVKKHSDKPKTYKTSNFQLEINTSSSTVGEDHEIREVVTEKARNDEFRKEIKVERQDDNSTKKCVKLSEKEFQCPQCEMVFVTIRKLRWHLMKVHDSDSCICHYCSKTFATKETLSKHVCKIDPLLIKCDVCDKKFEDALELSVHLKTVHNRVCCSHCTRNFANTQNLLEHYELVHQKSFICDQCTSSFRQKSQLLDHIRQVHLKLWLFPCLECKKEGISIGFKRKTYWNTHMEKHHSQIDTEGCFDESFREAFLGKMAEERGSRIDTLEANWENIREAVWAEESSNRVGIGFHGIRRNPWP